MLGAGPTTLSCKKKKINIAKNSVIENIQALGIRGSRKLSKERTEWRRITEKAKTHSGL